jgi:hypothetical protein
MSEGAWKSVQDAIDFAWHCIHEDSDPLNDRELADGERYLQYIVSTATQYSLMAAGTAEPAFIPPIETSRWLGASGPDIDYDVANIEPNTRYRITGDRGGSSYVGICVYANNSSGTAQAIVKNVDVDTLANAQGLFTYEFEHPAATRVIIRQYFHNRSTQNRGHWNLTRLVPVPHREQELPHSAEVSGRITMMAHSIRWNAQLNQLWGADLRQSPNQLTLQTAQDIVAAVPNPDVTYAFGWWRLDPGQQLEITVTPPSPSDSCRYWGLQVCDRWFQSHPDRRMNMNDRTALPNDDGTVTLILGENDPGHPNWLGTFGHTVGTMFFRWLHHSPSVAPTCRVTSNHNHN